jgi:hypothetical protein
VQCHFAKAGWHFYLFNSSIFEKISMTRLYFFRWPLIFFLLGLGLRLIGALFKIRHWPLADELLTGGTIISLAAILFAVIKLILLKKQQ